MTATEALRTARDHLLALHGHHDKAVDEFSWPDLGPTFNWAHDWFDSFARGNDGPGLVIVEERGRRTPSTSWPARRTRSPPGSRPRAYAAGTRSSSCSATSSSSGR